MEFRETDNPAGTVTPEEARRTLRPLLEGLGVTMHVWGAKRLLEGQERDDRKAKEQGYVLLRAGEHILNNLDEILTFDFKGNESEE